MKPTESDLRVIYHVLDDSWEVVQAAGEGCAPCAPCSGRVFPGEKHAMNHLMQELMAERSEAAARRPRPDLTPYCQIAHLLPAA